LPLQAAEIVKGFAGQHALCLQIQIEILSFAHSEPHRLIVVFGKNNKELVKEQFVIYAEPKLYSTIYINTLKDFFTIF